MDMVKLKKKMMLVPTPGQTEQQYLAKYFQERGFAPVFAQDEFCLQKSLDIARSFNYQFPSVDMENYEEAVKDFSNRFTASLPG